MTAQSERAHRPKHHGAITLESVAQRAGVSPITASRALRCSNLVAKATRERVVAAATELGYTPNLLARGLVHNRTATVGVVVLELANPFFAPMLSAIHAVAAKRGFLVVIGESSRDEEEERRYIEQFQQLRIAGIIVSPVTNKLDHLAAARANGTPVIVMARRWEDGDYVSTDDVEGGRLAAEHLLKRGHRRIALIRRGDARHAPVQAIAQGLHEVLGSAGIVVPDAWDVRVADGQIRDGMEATDRLLAQSERPSAAPTRNPRARGRRGHRL